MAAKDPNQVATKWANNLGAAGESIKNGVMAVTESPGAAAARKKDDYVRRVAERADVWASRLQAMSTGEWQDAMINKGLVRIAGGAQTAQPKMAAFMTQFLPHVENVARTVRAMPKGGLQNGINRAVAQIQGNAQFKYRKGQ